MFYLQEGFHVTYFDAKNQVVSRDALPEKYLCSFQHPTSAVEKVSATQAATTGC